jgi:hypothetical protein
MSITSPATPASLATELSELAQRIVLLEHDVAKLKQSKRNKARWLDKIRGSMKDDPEFAEIVRLGQEFRKSYFTD